MASNSAVRYPSFAPHQKRAHNQYPRTDSTQPGYSYYTKSWYVNVDDGLDTNTGNDPASPVKSFTKAVALASNLGFPNQLIQGTPSANAYHDDTGEVFPIIIDAALDNLTICSSSTLPGRARHTVIGATDEGDDSGLIYSLAENTRIIGLTFLSNKCPVFFGTETSHGTTTAVQTTGGLLKDCVLDTGATASQAALETSCIDMVIDSCDLIANGATTVAYTANDPFTITGSTIQAAVGGIDIVGGATLVTRIQNCVFECKPGTAALTGYAIDFGAGSSDAGIYDCLFCDGQEADGTGLIGADDDVYTGLVNIVGCFFPSDPYTSGAGAGDKTITTTAVSVLKAY